MSLPRMDTGVQEKDTSMYLSPITYDDDDSSLHSNRSAQDTDSDDDQLLAVARNSRELRARDRLVLMEEEEIQRLVTAGLAERDRQRRGSGLSIPNPLSVFKTSSRTRSGTRSRSPARTSTMDSIDVVPHQKRDKRRARRKEQRDRLMKEAQHGEDGQLMYEMESGVMKDGSTTGDSSDREEDSFELDRRNLLLHADKKTERKRKWKRWLFIHTIIVVGVAFVSLLTWKLSAMRRRPSISGQIVSNGTALFAPTTLIISLDGFRADFLNRGLTPRLNAFVKEGVSPPFMLPSFPSVTFPNHYTLATGLYPESHGVVGNTFWDPALEAEFFYTDPSRSLDSKWWTGEPFWVTAERQGLRTAIHMWPGSEAHVLGVEPSFLDTYKSKEALGKKVDRILELLDKPGMEEPDADPTDMRPQIIAAYVPDVDAAGHLYGPNSTDIRKTITEVDTMLDQVFHGLEVRNLTGIVNVIVVSDHGMATTDVSRMIQLEDLVDTSKIEHLDGWPLFGIRPKDPEDLRKLYDQATEKTKTNPNVDVYLRDENMPERWHFSNNERIAPMWIVPKTGWAIVEKKDFDIEEAKKKNLIYHPRGLHGYDHEHPLMRAIFIARGPAFPHKPNSRLDHFQNIEVYNILCDSVGMEPMPNNGTLRLPLKPVGLHDGKNPTQEPADPTPAPASAADKTASDTISISPIEAGSAADPQEKAPSAVGVDPVDTSAHPAGKPSTSPVGEDKVHPGPPPPSAVGVDPVHDTPARPTKKPSPEGNTAQNGKKKFGSVHEAWDWVKDKLGGVWTKVSHAIDDLKQPDASEESQSG